MNLQVHRDRYYLDGRIKIEYEDIQILKGMNANYITSHKSLDYRFISRLLLCIFATSELRSGCVRINKGEGSTTSVYNQLDPIKFDFVKGRLNQLKRTLVEHKIFWTISSLFSMSFQRYFERELKTTAKDIWKSGDM